MATNRRFLKAFAHIDAHGRVVPGMVILRKKKPTRGRWIEIQTYLCCPDPTTTTTTTTSTSTSTTTTTTTTAAPTTTTTTTTAAPTTTTTTTTSSSTTTTTTTGVPSDVRLKDNIQPTGNTVGGLNEYVWEWNSTAKSLGLDNNPTTGVLAQEAMKVYPEFVIFDEKIGYYRVNLNAISAIH